MTSTASTDAPDWTHTPSGAAIAFARALAVLPGAQLTAPAAAAAAGLDLPGARLHLTVLTALGAATDSAGRYRLAAHAPAAPDMPDHAFAGLAQWYVHSAKSALRAVGHDEGYWPAPGKPAGTGPIAPQDFTDPVIAYHWLVQEEENILAVSGAAADAGLHAQAWQLAALQLQVWSFRGLYTRWDEVAAAELEQAIEAADPLGHASALAHQARGLSQRGVLRRAEQLQLEALRVREEIGDQPGIAQSHNALGLIAHRRGDLQAAIEHYLACEQTAAACGYDYFVAVARHNRADALRTRGELEEAAALLGQAMDHYLEHGRHPGAASAAQILADIRGLQGQTTAALQAAQEALERSALVPDTAVTAWALRTVAGAFRRDARPRQAIEALRTAAALYASIDDSQRHAETLVLAAEHYDELGEVEQAAGRREEADALRARLAAADGEPGNTA